ncbi:Huntingtin-interacting protein K [Blattella germanica]|nr:Huntingtin-interacting protein K [Blattella germanica]
MADEEANGDIGGDSDEVQQEKSQKKIAKYDSGAADLEKVTDYAEEKEIFSADLSGMREMEISRILAERTLREHHGNVVEALVSLTD